MSERDPMTLTDDEVDRLMWHADVSVSPHSAHLSGTKPWDRARFRDELRAMLAAAGGEREPEAVPGGPICDHGTTRPGPDDWRTYPEGVRICKVCGEKQERRWVRASGTPAPAGGEPIETAYEVERAEKSLRSWVRDNARSWHAGDVERFDDLLLAVREAANREGAAVRASGTPAPECPKCGPAGDVLSLCAVCNNEWYTREQSMEHTRKIRAGTLTVWAPEPDAGAGYPSDAAVTAARRTLMLEPGFPVGFSRARIAEAIIAARDASGTPAPDGRPDCIRKGERCPVAFSSPRDWCGACRTKLMSVGAPPEPVVAAVAEYFRCLDVVRHAREIGGSFAMDGHLHPLHDAEQALRALLPGGAP